MALSAVSSPESPPRRAAPDADDVLRRVGMGRGRRWRRGLLALLVVAAAVTAAAWWWRGRNANGAPPRWQTVAADRGDLEVHVVATGSLQARSTVSVGAEISGRVAAVEVDVNDRVTRGQVLVRLDPITAANALAEARASLKSASADLERSKAALAEAKTLERRATDLASKGLVSTEENDAQRSAATLAGSDVSRSSAQLSLAKIRVEQARTNLEKLVIVSPIDGVVMSRAVEPGAAISASLAAPVLFTIAEDLTKMELALPINEADVSRVREGQRASFQVDAWSDRTFEAQVQEVSFAPVVTNNVVTYSATLAVDNADLALRPGMTATATIVSDTRKQALRVPSAALRYSPPVNRDSKAWNPLAPPRMRGMGGPGGPGGEKAQPPGVWVLGEQGPTRVRVTLGASDGEYTEIVGGELAEGDAVLVGHEAQGPA
ncbi:MAG: efflux RND transporter periplasmic adaptor subunit [Nannocystaceae bacterium]|nr:efflux RND transporter periplasmic adaptor subunit [Nannocystaceae bacterium]